MKLQLLSTTLTRTVPQLEVAIFNVCDDAGKPISGQQVQLTSPKGLIPIPEPATDADRHTITIEKLLPLPA